ncbi:MAG: PTS sugar transporter subunit IIA [Gammaproteobacteria bacterium]|nr:PTS sugar transporter subunit IIA [Gammaproteobacteria bacterium]
MDISSMLKPRNIRCEVSAGSKKHALELLSEALADAVGGPTAGEVLEGLASRERLGSTGLGSAIAMPHAKVAGIEESAAALLKLSEPIEFDAPDGEPVDLLFGLLVPERISSADLETLNEVARKLRDPQLQDKLRSSDDPSFLCTLLVDSLGPAGTPH